MLVQPVVVRQHGRDGQMSVVRTTGGFERSDRLLESKDYQRVMRRGRRHASAELVVITTPRRIVSTNKNKHLGDFIQTGSRLGITASRKVGNAVVRNRFKRRLREWFRLRRHEFRDDIDLVVIGRRAGGMLSAAELDERLVGLLGLESGSGRQAAK